MTKKKHRKKENKRILKSIPKKEEVINLTRSIADEKEVKNIKDAYKTISGVTDYKPRSVRDIISKEAPKELREKLKGRKTGEGKEKAQTDRQEVLDIAKEISAEEKIKSIEDACKTISRVTPYKKSSIRKIIHEEAPKELNDKLKSEKSKDPTLISRSTQKKKEKIPEVMERLKKVDSAKELEKIYNQLLMEEGIGAKTAEDIIKTSTDRLEKKKDKSNNKK